MRIVKTSKFSGFDDKNTPEAYAKMVDGDFNNLFLFSQGRVRFGGSGNQLSGENISGEWEDLTTASTANAEVVIAHTLGVKPEGFLITNINANGVVYRGSSPWDENYAYFCCSTPNALVSLFLLK